MATVLFVSSSINGDRSVSKQLATHFLTEWHRRFPEDTVITRDLLVNQPPFVNAAYMSARTKQPTDYTPEEAAIIGASNQLIDELMAADYIVFGAPVYNYTLPTPLKAYIDLNFRTGKTVESTPEGQRGLLGGRKVLVISPRLGEYGPGSGREHFDYQEPYFRFVLGRLGLTDVTYLPASLNPMIHDEPTREERMAGFRKSLDQVVSAWSSDRAQATPAA